MSSVDLELLLAEDAWLRRFALRLAGDAAAADDLVQETWVAALAAGEAPRAARPWLAGTLRNLRRRLARGDGRRAARERAEPAREPVLPTDEIVADLALRRAVVDALLALDDPERDALYRRFFRDASLSEIASAQGVAVSTVHARVERGLERMRARLDAEHGGRRAWAVALLGPICGAGDATIVRGSGKPSGATAGLTQGKWLGGALVMTTTWKALAGVAAAVLVGWWWQGRGLVPRAADAVGGVEVALDGLDAELAAGSGEPVDGASVAAVPAAAGRAPAAGPAAADEPTAKPIAMEKHRGRVIDLGGAPLAGVAVRLLAREMQVPRIGTPDPRATPIEPAPAQLGSAVTGDDGAFVLETPVDTTAPLYTDAPHFAAPAARRGFALDDPTWTLVSTTADASGATLLLAAPRVTLAGTVLDPDGRKLPGAEVQLVVLEDVFRDLGLAYSINVQLPAWGTRTDSDGRFRLEDVVGGEHTSLFSPFGLHKGAHLTPPPRDALDLVLRLSERDGVLPVTGIVLDAGGAPVAGAAVSLGADIVESGADGRFELAWDVEHGRGFAEAIAKGMSPRPMPQSHATAYAPGLGVARVELTREVAAAPVVLRLAGEPLALAGRVVDGAGEPIDGAQVWMADPTHFGSTKELVGRGYTMSPQSLEERIAGARSTVSDASGAFVLEGLLDREYALRAFDGRTYTFGAGRTVRAGAAGVELVVATDPSATRVAGRVTSLGGEPLVGVDVRPQRAANLPELEWPPSPFLLGRLTDADGRFEFAELSVAGTDLMLFGMQSYDYFVERVSLAGFADLQRVEIALPLPCKLQVVLTDPDLANQARVYDADGVEIQVLEHHGSYSISPDFVTIEAGTSLVVSVNERASEIALAKDGVEVLRLPLRVDPARVTTVEY